MPSIVTQTRLRIAALVGSLVILVLTGMTVAAGDELGNSSGGWDYSDPLNLTESRVWAALYWDWRDTGVVSNELAGFQFTNPVPNDLTPIDYAYDLFEELYATELATLSTPESPYSVIQLILDDPNVMQQFRIYTTTGFLSTIFVQNQNATWSHLDMIALAASGQGYSMEGVWIDAGIVTTQSLLAPPGAVALPPLTPPFNNPDTPDELLDFQRELERLLAESPLKDIMYRHDSFTPPIPGFDCDDYAISMAAWLRQLQQMYPGLQLHLLLFWYDKDDGTRGGHAATIVRIGRYYYIIDTQSNRLKGPYPAQLWPMYPMRELLCEEPGYGSQCNTQNLKWREISPYYWIPGEPAPWYADPNRLAEICDELEAIDQLDGVDDFTCQDFIWDNVGGV